MNYVLGEFCFHFLYLIKNKLVLELHWSNTVAESKEAESSRHEELWVGEAMQRSWTFASSCFAEPPCQGSRAMHRGVVGQELEHRAPSHHSLHPTAWAHLRESPNHCWEDAHTRDEDLDLYFYYQFLRWPIFQLAWVVYPTPQLAVYCYPKK